MELGTSARLPPKPRRPIAFDHPRASCLTPYARALPLHQASVLHASWRLPVPSARHGRVPRRPVFCRVLRLSRQAPLRMISGDFRGSVMGALVLCSLIVIGYWLWKRWSTGQRSGGLGTQWTPELASVGPKRSRPRSPLAPEYWVPPGRATTVAGVSVPGGMLYVGQGL